MSKLEVSCQTLFVGAELDSGLADKIEERHPRAECEAVRVHPSSPGPISDEETVYRILVSPVDFSEDGDVLQRPFEKVYKNGVSVVRSVATAEEVKEIAEDRLSSEDSGEARQVRAIFAAPVGGVGGLRSMQDEEKEQLFGVYDQVVSRKSDPNALITSHAGVFLRRPAKGTIGRKRLQKDYAGRLREIFLAQEVELSTFYGGVVAILNRSILTERSA